MEDTVNSEMNYNFEVDSSLQKLGIDATSQFVQRLPGVTLSQILQSRLVYKLAVIYAARGSHKQLLKEISIAHLVEFNDIEENNPFIAALRKADFHTFRQLLQGDAGINLFRQVNIYDVITALIFHGCDSDLFQFLLDHVKELFGHEPDCKYFMSEYDSFGMTALISSVVADNISCMSTLLNMGADINATDSSQEFDLVAGSSNTTQEFTEAGTSCQNDEDKTIKSGKGITSKQINTFAQDSLSGGSKTAVMYAICIGNSHCVERLLDFKPSLAIRSITGMSALNYAALLGDFTCMELLLNRHSVLFETRFLTTNRNKGWQKHRGSVRNNVYRNEVYRRPTKAKRNRPSLTRIPSTTITLVGDNSDDKCMCLFELENSLETGDNFIEHPNNNEFFNAKRRLGKSKNVNMQSVAAENSLSYAVIGGNAKSVEFLLPYCHNLSVVHKSGKSALLLALEKDKLDLAELILKSGVNVDKTVGETTALKYACKLGRTDAVHLLLNYKANLEITNHEWSKETALCIAVKHNQPECLRILLDHGALVNVNLLDGKAPLIAAMDIDSQECFNMILKANNGFYFDSTINQWKWTGAVALPVAAKNGIDSYVDILLKHRCDIEHIENRSPDKEFNDLSFSQEKQLIFLEVEEALPDAVRGQNIAIISKILKYCHNVDRLNVNDYTALMLAAITGRYDIIEMLFKKGADVNIINKNGFTALLCAVVNKQLNALNVLLKHGADPNLIGVPENVYNAVSLATRLNWVDGLETIIKHGADVNMTIGIWNKKSLSPLLYAISNKKGNDKKIIDLLVSAGAVIKNNDLPLLSTSRLRIIFEKPDELANLFESGRIIFQDTSSLAIYNDRIDAHHMSRMEYKLFTSPQIFHSMKVLMKFGAFNWRNWCNYQNFTEIMFLAIEAKATPDLWRYHHHNHSAIRSPMMHALFEKWLYVMKFLASNLYLTWDDYKTLMNYRSFSNNPDVKFAYLKEMENQLPSTLSTYEEVVEADPCIAMIIQNPWRLETLCLLTVSTALFKTCKTPVERCKAIENLHIPNKFKAILRFEGNHHKLCSSHWHLIGTPPEGQPQDIMCLTKPTYPTSDLLEQCHHRQKKCLGTRLAVINFPIVDSRFSYRYDTDSEYEFERNLMKYISTESGF